ncbi:MAG: serine/threonine protein kinase, partial [Muribaculaceae bacterium]|nr:serine/threonine protein kinase [Muribaculaceae bacterium]
MANNTVDRNSMLQVGTLLRGIYRIDNYLSSGGFGNTYVATNIEFDEQVAIKEFFIKGMSHRDTDTSGVNVSNLENVDQFNKMRDIFKREAKRLRLLGRFNNPHIVRVHDLFEANNTAYYVMQYINGSSLSELLKNQSGPFDTGWLMDSVLPQVLDALGVMHRNQMWHLDIKPSNIMVDVNGNVMIIDFGSTKQIDPNTGDPTISSTLSFTTTYAPLELQEYDYKKIGPWTDLYSLGATLYNLSTGKKPPRTSAINNEGVGAFQFFPGTKEEFKKLVVWMMSIR